jgi:hypothetical protein
MAPPSVVERQQLRDSQRQRRAVRIARKAEAG